jgi:hypothetical protein
MQNKILAVIKKITENLNSIEELTFNKDNTEYYFIFREVIFSVLKRQKASGLGRFSFYMYPHADSISELEMSFDSGEGDEIPLVTLHERDLSIQDKLLISNFYEKLNEKLLGTDEIFDKLLK